jgi:hypothetical protein
MSGSCQVADNYICLVAVFLNNNASFSKPCVQFTNQDGSCKISWVGGIGIGVGGALVNVKSVFLYYCVRIILTLNNGAQ